MEMFPTHIGPSFHGREYRIEDLVGEGFFGKVYKVRQEESHCASPLLRNQLLALKMYHYASLSYQRPILDEIIQMMTIANSPHIASFFDRSPRGEKPEYMVMEYVPETMHTRLGQSSHTNVIHELVKLYLQQMPVILETLWKAGMVHGDITLPNIGIKEDCLKLLDFGLAKTSRFCRGDIPTKRIFYPPEAREGLITSTLDVYCAGKMLEYVLLRKYASSVQETIQNIEFLHDLTLPISWHKLFRGMLHPHFEKRVRPQQLYQLSEKAVKDMDAFLFQDFVPLNKADLLPSSSSFLSG